MIREAVRRLMIDEDDTLKIFKGLPSGCSSQSGVITTREVTVSPKLDLLSNLEMSQTAGRRKDKSMKRKIRKEEISLIGNEEAVLAGLQDIKDKATAALHEGRLMNRVHGSYLMDILEELSLSTQAIIDQQYTMQPLLKKHSRADIASNTCQMIDLTKPVKVDRGTDMDLTPS